MSNHQSNNHSDKIVYKNNHIKYDLFHDDDEILLNVGAGLYSIYAQEFQITAMATPSGGEHV